MNQAQTRLPSSYTDEEWAELSTAEQRGAWKQAVAAMFEALLELRTGDASAMVRFDELTNALVFSGRTIRAPT